MVENAKYEVAMKLGNVEIRRYPRLIVAKVEGKRDGGFDILLRFISGENKKKAKVKMTAPVLSETSSLSFVMPEEYELETTPEPIDKRVKIIQVPERFVAALRFSGRWSQSIFNSRSEELLKKLSEAKVETKGKVFAMLYNPPYTPWFMRRNEVAIEVELN